MSDEWIDESRKIRDEYKSRIPEIPIVVRMNQIINEVPFGDGVIRAHLDTSDGHIDLELGHLDKPDLTLTLSYATARALLVDGDASAALNAFLGGKIKIDGDITKMMSMFNANAPSSVDPAALEMVKRIHAMTE